MGSCSSKNKIIETFKEYTSIIELKNDILKNNLANDCDIIVSLDCSLSNNFKDGTSLHDIPYSFPKISKSIIENPYIYILELLSEFINNDNKGNNNFSLYFFGTYKGNSNTDKLEPAIYKYNHYDSNNKITNNNTNQCTKITDLINLYIGSIKAIQNTNHHTAFGINKFSDNSSIVPSIEKTIETVKKTKKFTLLLLISDGKFDPKNNHKITDIVNKASHYPISIIFVGLGNADFTFMHNLDRNKGNKKSKKKKFDNLHFVALNSIVKRPIISKSIRDDIYINMFSEIVQQYNYIKRPDILNYKQIQVAL